MGGCRAGGRTPVLPGQGGVGAHDAQGPHVAYEIFSSFLMFSKFFEDIRA